MEQYFLVAVKAIVPLFLLILTGTYIRWRKLLDDHEIRRVNSMVFEVFFFCMMFHNLYITSLDQALRPKLIVFPLLPSSPSSPGRRFSSCGSPRTTRPAGP